ncbi:MAG: YbbR-like domain-containing protein [Marvinbryantia sp.]|jgi:YbbR domain-containing protein
MKLRHKITYNFGLKLLSVVTACLIWLMVMDNNDPERTQVYRNVGVVIKNSDTITNANKTFSVLEGTEKVNVYVTARESVRKKLTAASFTVKADMEEYNAAIGSVPLQVSCSDSSVRQEDIRIQPSSLKISMEDKIEESFGIVESISGTAQKGYELGSTTILSGDTIKIAGPESLINIIGKVTVPIDITNLSENKTSSYTIRIQDKNGANMTENQMNNLELKTVSGAVLEKNQASVHLDVWKVYNDIEVNVPLLGEPAEGYEVTEITVSPKTVNIAAKEEMIENLGGQLKAIDGVNISGVSSNVEAQIDLTETLAQYKDLRLEEETSPVVLVNVRVDKIGTRTIDFPVSQIDLVNPPADKRLVFTPTDQLPVNIRAEEEQLNALKTEDIQASIDLSAYTRNGNYTIPVEIVLPEGCELGEKVTIAVSMQDEEMEQEIEPQTGE